MLDIHVRGEKGVDRKDEQKLPKDYFIESSSKWESVSRAGGRFRRTWPAHGLGKWEVPAGYKFSRERGRGRR